MACKRISAPARTLETGQFALGGVRLFLKRLRGNPRHFRFARKFDERNGKAILHFFQMNAGGCVNARRGRAGLR